jgi:hypothetical protein
MKTKRKAVSAFWDMRAVVPLCCQQNLSQSMRKLWRETTRVVVWWGTIVEVRSAISRLHDEGLLTARGRQQALARLKVLTAGVARDDAERQGAWSRGAFAGCLRVARTGFVSTRGGACLVQ